LYGGPPPKEIIDLPMKEIGKSIEVDPPFDPTQTLKDLREARAIVVQPAKGEPATLSDDPS
jgi:hypothetical protein